MSKPATFYKSYLDDMFARGVDAEVSTRRRTTPRTRLARC